MSLSLERISERVARNGDPNHPETPRPLLSLAEFFEGNEVMGSIGCNLPSAPGPQELYEVFKSIARRPEVVDIRVSVTAFDDPDWPFSDTVYVVTSASAEEVANWFAIDLAPDETWAGFSSHQSHESYSVPPGFTAVGCWWD